MRSELDRAEDRARYWRREYQAEANENTTIRRVLGISPTDPDETLTADAVRAAIARTPTGEAVELVVRLAPYLGAYLPDALREEVREHVDAWQAKKTKR